MLSRDQTFGRRPIPAALALALAAVLGGCAAATTPQTGSLAATGSLQYAVTPAELNWHCGALDNAISVHIDRIVALKKQAKAESEAAAPTLLRLFTRMFEGPGADIGATKQIETERAAADALNGTLRAKGCTPVDIDANLTGAPMTGSGAPIRDIAGGI